MDDCPSTSGSCNDFEQLLAQFKSLMDAGLPKMGSELGKEIERRGLVPKRTDLEGNKHTQTFRQYLSTRPWNTIKSVSQLFTTSRPSPSFTQLEHLRNTRLAVNSILPRQKTISQLQLIRAREMGVSIPPNRLHPIESPSLLDRQLRVLGHVDKVYNVKFDQTGRFLFTASDDHLIKCWDLQTGLLRHTFRGTPEVILDMAISPCNQLLVTVSQVDKKVRLWSMQKGALMQCFSLHTAEIVGARFLNRVTGSIRWLVSFGNDCNVIFYPYNEDTLELGKAQIYNVRTATGLKLFSGGSSNCGSWSSFGDSQGTVHVFNFVGLDKIIGETELKGIGVNEKLDSLEWAHDGPAFAVASTKHHSGRIWRLLGGQWHYIDFQPQLPDEDVMKLFHNTKLKYCVCMLAWTPDDSSIVASGNDNSVRVFDAFTGKQQQILRGHANEVYHLHFAPYHPHLLFTSGHDGVILLWNMQTGEQLKRIVNDGGDSQIVINSAVLDVAMSADGVQLATVDDIGRITLYGFGTTDHHQVPREQFFALDYADMELDASGYALCLQTGFASHLCPPSLLVDLEQLPHPDKWQSKVPGREPGANSDVSPWLTREIVPKLERGVLESWQKRIAESEAVSFGFWDKDHRFALYRNPDDDLAVAPVPNTSRSRQRAQLPTVEELIQQQDARRAAGNMDGYRSEDDVSYSGSDTDRVEEVESDEEEEDSDYVENEPGRRHEQRGSGDEEHHITTSSGRRVKPRVLENQTSASPERAPRKSKKSTTECGEDELATDAENGVDEPGPSHVGTLPKPKSKKKIIHGFLETFPSSMQIVKSKRFPYIAQLGDRIVYMKQGHVNYLERVEALKLYNVKNKMRPPADLGAEVFCKVEEVKYTRKPYRLTSLQLAVLDRHDEKTGRYITVRYHDLEGCPDFLILRHHYDLAMSQALKEGDEMEALIDGLWWTGSIIKKEPFDPLFSSSHWNSLKIRWDNGEEEMMSPWECQPKTLGRKSNTPASLEDEIELGQCPPQDGDWPGDERPSQNKEASCERLAFALDELTCMETVEPFAYPVNLSLFVTYAACVDYSIDLQTISERLRSGFYRRLEAVQHDIRHISVAAEQFNESDSQIVYNSRRLVEALIRFSHDTSIEKEEIKTFYTSMYDLEEQQIVEYHKRNRIQIDPDVLELAANSQVVAPAEAGWIRETRSILASIFRQNAAKHFLCCETASDENVKEVLSVCGDLNSVINDLSVFSSPEDVVRKIEDILTAVSDAIEDGRSRVRDCTRQVMNMVRVNMDTVVNEFNRIVNGEGLVPRLRKRIRKNVYETRSSDREPRGTRRQQEPGFYKQMLSGHASSSRASPPDRTTRATRRALRSTFSGASGGSRGSSAAPSNYGGSRRNSVVPVKDEDEEVEEEKEENAVEENPEVANIMKNEEASGSSSSSEGSEESEFSDPDEEMHRSVRQRRRESEEMMEELQELAEDAEETMHNGRKNGRVTKRKRISSDSEEEEEEVYSRKRTKNTRKLTRLREDDSGDEVVNSRRLRLRTRRNKRSSCSNNDDDDDDRIDVSQRGRVRRSTRRYE